MDEFAAMYIPGVHCSRSSPGKATHPGGTSSSRSSYGDGPQVVGEWPKSVLICFKGFSCDWPKPALQPSPGTSTTHCF